MVPAVQRTGRTHSRGGVGLGGSDVYQLYRIRRPVPRGSGSAKACQGRQPAKALGWGRTAPSPRQLPFRTRVVAGQGWARLGRVERAAQIYFSSGDDRHGPAVRLRPMVLMNAKESMQTAQNIGRQPTAGGRVGSEVIEPTPAPPRPATAVALCGRSGAVTRSALALWRGGGLHCVATVWQAWPSALQTVCQSVCPSARGQPVPSIRDEPAPARPGSSLRLLVPSSLRCPGGS